MTVEAGRKLGRYVLSRKLGAGGMAEVWEAFDEGLHRSVAVKVVRDEIAGEVEFRERFVREARLAAQLEHPRILPIYDFGTEAGVTYLVMPLLPGGTLRERIHGPMPADETVDALAAIAAALDHAHARGVLHRDVKPSNVLVDASGSLLLADFGLAKNTAVSSELTAAGMVIGTPAYMAPEQAIGRPVDPRADQYALGIIAFELLTGRTPFRSESPFAVLDKHLREAPPPPSSFVPGLGYGVDAVLAKTLAKDPRDRFGSCREMVEALAAALGASMPARPSTAIRAATGGDPTWVAGAGGPPTPSRRTPPPLAQPSNVTLPSPPPNLTIPAPLTAATVRRPAPSGPPTGVLVAAIVVVAVLIVAGAVVAGWMFLGTRGEPAEPATGATTVPDLVAPATPPPPTQPAGAPGTPAPEEPAGTEPVAAEEPSRVTVEELALPTAPPGPTPRATPVPARSPAGGRPAVAPTPAPEPGAAEPAGEPERPAETPGAASRLERSVPFRTGEEIELGIVDRLVTIRSVEVTGWPKPDEVRKAEGKQDETTKLTVKLTYANRDDDDWKCLFRVAVLDETGKEIGSGERETSLSGDEKNDTKRLSVKLRTLDFPKAAKIRVRISAHPD